MSENKTAKRPSHFAYQVSEGQDGKSYFNKIGAAFEHKDGQGYNVTLDSVPVDGRVSLRTPLERLDQLRSEPEPQAQGKQAGQQQQSAPQQAQADQGHDR